MSSNTVLYAENDEDDQDMLRELLYRINPLLNVVCFPNGLDLIQYLESMPPGEPLPRFIVLDMNMPFWDGLRTLECIRRRPRYNSLIVFVLTTSNLLRDKELAMQHGATAFFTKPFGKDDEMVLMEQLEMYCK